MSPWDIAAIGYGVIATLTSIPILYAMFQRAHLDITDATLACPAHFSGNTRQQWEDYCQRILATLRSWKKQRAVYNRFHYYCVWWSLISSWLVPFIGGFGGGEAKWLIVTVSGHVALVLLLHNRLKVDENLSAFRYGERELDDLNRHLQHQPQKYGGEQAEQLAAYIQAAEDIQKKVHSAEIHGIANVEYGEHRDS